MEDSKYRTIAGKRDEYIYVFYTCVTYASDDEFEHFIENSLTPLLTYV